MHSVYRIAGGILLALAALLVVWTVVAVALVLGYGAPPFGMPEVLIQLTVAGLLYAVARWCGRRADRLPARGVAAG